VGEQAYLVHGSASLVEFQLRQDDVLCVSTSAGMPFDAAWPSVFEPRTMGHPMLGRCEAGRLLSLPAGLPCTADHWSLRGAAVAVWRRGIWGQGAGEVLAAPVVSSPVQAGPRRSWALCVLVPRPAQAAQAIVAPSQESLGPSQEPQGQPPQSRDPLQGLAARLADALGAGAVIERDDEEQIRVVGRREIPFTQIAGLAKSLYGLARLPLSVAVAEREGEARDAASRLGPDELLVLLPGAELGQPEQQAPAAATSLALVRSRPAATVQTSIPRWSSSGQLCLFDDLQAA